MADGLNCFEDTVDGGILVSSGLRNMNGEGAVLEGSTKVVIEPSVENSPLHDAEPSVSMSWNLS